MGQMMKPRKTEITDKLRQEINKVQACDCVGSGNQIQFLLYGGLGLTSKENACCSFFFNKPPNDSLISIVNTSKTLTSVSSSN